MKRYISGASLRAHSHSHAETARPVGTRNQEVCEIDLNYVLQAYPPLTDEQLAMHWERVELHAAEQRAKYWHAVTPLEGSPDAKPETAIHGWAGSFHEDDISISSWTPHGAGGQQVGAMGRAAVLALHRPTGIAVHVDSERSQYANKQAAIVKLQRILLRQPGPMVGEPMPCAGCGGAESVCNCDCGGNYCGCSCHQAGPL